MPNTRECAYAATSIYGARLAALTSFPGPGRSIGLLSDRVYRGLLLCTSLILAGYGLVLIGRGAHALVLDGPPEPGR
jgi:hypothetical protein